MKRIVLISVFMIISFFVVNINISAEEIINLYHEPTIDDRFENDKIIVTLEKEYSEVNKKINKETFGFIDENILEKNNISIVQDMNIFNQIGVKEIKDLSKVDNPNKILDKDEYMQILELTLSQPGKQNVLDAISLLEQIYCVHAAEPVYIFENVPFSISSVDDYYSDQWALHDTYGINIEPLWDILEETMNPIQVGVFERYVDVSHSDLLGRVTAEQMSNTADDGHGSHVTGIIGAKNDNQGIRGIVQSNIVVLGAVNTSFAYMYQILMNKEIKIVNVSQGNGILNERTGEINTRDANSYEKNMINNFGTSGGIVVAGAGNTQSNIDVDPVYPASYSNPNNGSNYLANVISVGAIDKYGNLATFDPNNPNFKGSNYGSNSVQIYAPGKEIKSTINDDSYGSMSGTSMAAPHVTGVAALIMSIENIYGYTGVTGYSYVERIKDSIINGSRAHSITLPNGQTQNVKILDATKVFKYYVETYLISSNSNIYLSQNNINQNFSKIINNSNYYTDKNYVIRLDQNYTREYSFLVTSDQQFEVKLFDSSFNEININKVITNNSIAFDFNGIMTNVNYMEIKFLGESTQTVNIKVTPKSHSHFFQYEYYNDNYHRKYCECGNSSLEEHIWSLPGLLSTYAIELRLTCENCGYSKIA